MYSSTDIARMIKSERLNRLRHVAHIRKYEMHTEVRLEGLKKISGRVSEDNIKINRSRNHCTNSNGTEGK